MNEENRLQIIIRSICFKTDGIITDFDSITSQMKSKSQFDSELITKTPESLVFKVNYENVNYQITFVRFIQTALAEANMEIIIKK
jgi:hypothetical protein